MCMYRLLVKQEIFQSKHFATLENGEELGCAVSQNTVQFPDVTRTGESRSCGCAGIVSALEHPQGIHCFASSQ